MSYAVEHRVSQVWREWTHPALLSGWKGTASISHQEASRRRAGRQAIDEGCEACREAEEGEQMEDCIAQESRVYAYAEGGEG